MIIYYIIAKIFNSCDGYMKLQLWTVLKGEKSFNYMWNDFYISLFTSKDALFPHLQPLYIIAISQSLSPVISMI